MVNAVQMERQGAKEVRCNNPEESGIFARDWDKQATENCDGRVHHIVEAMSTVHMSEAKVARDLHAAIAQVQQGVEIVIKAVSLVHRRVNAIRAYESRSQAERVHRPGQGLRSQTGRRTHRR